MNSQVGISANACRPIRRVRVLVLAVAVAVLSGLVGTGASLGESGPPVEGSQAQLPAIEAVRLAEAYRLVEEVGNRIWPGFDSVPFPVLLVTDEIEYLVGWEKAAPQGFEALGVDKILRKNVLSRPATFPPGIEASFPAFGPPAVVVLGTAQATERTSAEWVLTVLHEHLHQLQHEAPGSSTRLAPGSGRCSIAGVWNGRSVT